MTMISLIERSTMMEEGAYRQLAGLPKLIEEHFIQITPKAGRMEACLFLACVTCVQELRNRLKEWLTGE